jgi:hypothetical protein
MRWFILGVGGWCLVIGWVLAALRLAKRADEHCGLGQGEHGWAGERGNPSS